MRAGGHGEPGGNGGIDIDEPAQAEIGPAGAVDQHRRALAGMVGAAPGRVVAVIGGDDEQIARPEPRQKRRQGGVEPLEMAGIARDVAPVTEFAVELDQIGEDETAGCGLSGKIEQDGEEPGIAPARGLVLMGDAAMGEDVADLADGMGRPAGGEGPVEKRRCGRGNGEVAPVAGAVEAALGRAGEGAGDDTADLYLMGHRREAGAEVEEPRKPEALLMGGNLDDAVGRGIDDRPPRPHVFGAEAGDDLGARCVAIAEHPVRAGQIGDAAGDPFGQGRHGVGEDVPSPGHRHAGQLPMAGRGVLAGGLLGGRGPAAPERHIGQRAGVIAGRREGPAETERRHVGQMEGARAPRRIGPPPGAGLGDVTDGVGAFIAETGGIGCAADADAVEHNEKGASVGGGFHRLFSGFGAVAWLM